MDINFGSLDYRERLLSNLAHTPFVITINRQDFHCESVEGFWQGLKFEEEKRKEVFQLHGFPAKYAGKGIKKEVFSIAGGTFKTGSSSHENLIAEAIYQKILQNPNVKQVLLESDGEFTHNVPGKPIFKVEKIMKRLYNRLTFLSKLEQI
jgi:hypothetical protein